MKKDSHLSSEQLDNLLGREPNVLWQEHVDRCDDCAAELSALRAVLGDFRLAASASAKHHRYLAPAASRRLPGAAWGVVFAALLLAFGAPLTVHHFGAHANVAIIEQKDSTARQTPTAEISDDALLAGVQNDLSASVPRSMLPLSNTSNANAETRKDE